MAIKREAYQSSGGELYLSILDPNTGNFLPMKELGETASISLEYSKEEMDQNSTKGCIPTLRDKRTKKHNLKLKATCQDINKDTTALAYLADIIETTQTAQTDTTLVVLPELIALDAYVNLEVYDITALEVKNQAEDVTYTEGTDYSFDYSRGMLYIIPTGTIVETEELHLKYSVKQKEVVTVATFKKQQIKCKVMFDSCEGSGNDKRIIINEAFLNMQGSLDLKGDKYSEFSFDFDVVATSNSGDLSDYMVIIDIDEKKKTPVV